MQDGRPEKLPVCAQIIAHGAIKSKRNLNYLSMFINWLGEFGGTRDGTVRALPSRRRRAQLERDFVVQIVAD